MWGELTATLRKMERVVLAFSGGADSSLLLRACLEAGTQVLAATFRSELSFPREIEDAAALAAAWGVRHVILPGADLEKPYFKENPPKRCYFCKKDMYTNLVSLARAQGYTRVVDGTNAGDTADYRPGLIAARELGVRSPLVEAGISKEDVYALSRWLELPTAGKPPSPCLATRFPYGVAITREGLRVVMRAEDFLKKMGIEQVRVRHYGDLARLEVAPSDFAKVLAGASEIVGELKSAGYKYITLDLEGYRTGSMNAVLGGGTVAGGG